MCVRAQLCCLTHTARWRKHGWLLCTTPTKCCHSTREKKKLHRTFEYAKPSKPRAADGPQVNDGRNAGDGRQPRLTRAFL